MGSIPWLAAPRRFLAAGGLSWVLRREISEGQKGARIFGVRSGQLKTKFYNRRLISPPPLLCSLFHRPNDVPCPFEKVSSRPMASARSMAAVSPGSTLFEGDRGRPSFACPLLGLSLILMLFFRSARSKTLGVGGAKLCESSVRKPCVPCLGQRYVPQLAKKQSRDIRCVVKGEFRL